jgi:hypothetical protein
LDPRAATAKAATDYFNKLQYFPLWQYLLARHKHDKTEQTFKYGVELLEIERESVHARDLTQPV